MIPEMSVHARPTNTKARTVVCACFISALLLLILSAIVDKYTGLFGMAILIMLTAAIFFYTKYMAAKYIYDLTTADDHSPILIARSIVGKRQSTLMRIDMYTVTSVERLGREELRTYRAEPGVLKYTYSPTFLPDSMILIKTRGRYEKADIFIEAPEEFETLIRETSEYARSIYTEDEE